MGLGVVGLEPDRLAVFGDGLGHLPLGAAGRRRGWCGPRRGRAGAGSPRGIRRSASATFPWPAGRGRGCSGPRRRRAGAGSPRGRRRRPGRGSARLGGPAVLLQVPPQAAQVPRGLRPSLRQVAEDRLGLGAAAHPLEQVGQLVRRLGAQGAGRRVVPHRLLAGRRPQLVQGPGQGVVDPDVAGVAARPRRSRATAASAWPTSARVSPSRTAVGAGSSAASGAAASAFSAAACGLRSSARRIARSRSRYGRGRPAAPPPAASARRRPAASPRGARPTSRRGRPTARSTTASGCRLSRRATSAGSRASRSSPASRKAVGVGGVGALGADVLLIGPDLDELLPQPGVALGLVQAGPDLAAQGDPVAASGACRPSLGPLHRRQGVAPAAGSPASRRALSRSAVASASTWANRAARRCRCWSSR